MASNRSREAFAMICVVCKRGNTKPGKTTLTLERGGMTLVAKAVPAQVCEVCGESYVDEATTAQLLQQAAEAFQAGVQVEVRAYVAA
jgi:YgiT-type zinc finger domain-containing protein